MKHLKATLLIACVAGLGLAATVSGAVTQVSSKITAVTLFGDRAVVTRTAEINLPAGANHLVFKDIPISADENSIQAEFTGSQLSVLGLTHKVVTAAIDSTRMLRLNQMLDTLYNHKLAALNDRKNVLDTQKELLEQLVANAGKTLTDDLTKATFNSKNWDEAYSFISRNLRAVVDSLRTIGLESAVINDRCHQLEIELSSLQAEAVHQAREVSVDVEVGSAGVAQIALDYIVPQASWSPLYNARLIDSNRVELSCFGQVIQRTGEDWIDVELTLSTALPNRVTSPGSLAQRILSSLDPLIQRFGSIHFRGGLTNEITYVIDGVSVNDPLGGSDAGDLAIIKDGFDAEYGNAPAPYVSAVQTTTAYSTKFTASRSETIPSGDQVVRAPIAQWIVNGEEHLISRPQNYQNVFRFINLKNTTGAPLLPGTINLFARSDFLGRLASPDLILPGQEFEMPFGIEDGIEVRREILNRINVIDGDKRGLSETVNISLVNNTGVDRSIELEEALLVSSDSRIRVEIKSMTPKPVETDAENKAKWKVKLAANGKATITIDYKIEYPRTMSLSGM